MADARTRAVLCSDGKARHSPRSRIDHPEIALDHAAIDQAAHEIYPALLGRVGVDCRAIAGKGRDAGGEFQPALRPWVWGIRRSFKSANWTTACLGHELAELAGRSTLDRRRYGMQRKPQH